MEENRKENIKNTPNMHVGDDTQTPHKRRVRYKGKYPKKFEEKYKELEKAALSVKEKDAYDKWKPFIKTEQYDAVQSYLEYVKTNPYFDFSYGMGEKMYGSGDFTYESRGVVNNIAESFLRGENATEKWDKIRDDMTVKIDEEIKRFNEQ